MEDEELKNSDRDYSIDNNSTAVNQLILDYYKKFGRKRDIEQFFSLSTAQQDLNDPTSSFWRRMKEQNESSDSGDKRTSPSTELCRISLKCSMEQPQYSQETKKDTKSDTESPPIISDDVPHKVNSGDESNKSDDGSHKSIDVTLDISMNRPHSPTSSITSQRKLEWDSLADVGYANESVRKNSASSLSTLERLALHQQYSNNDTKQNSDLGLPTAQSTPMDQSANKSKDKHEVHKKTTTLRKKDVDIMELNLPHNTDIIHHPINVNLTKYISFNVEKNGNIKMDDMIKKISVNRENLPEIPEETQKVNLDKQIQTTLQYTHGKNIVSKDNSHGLKQPVLFSLNTLRRNVKKKHKKKVSRRRKATRNKENIPQDKNTNQESDAESFEYLPGYVYNQNEFQNNNPQMNVVDNKSSLESSAGHTTESSRDLKCAFTKEIEKSIDLLKLALQHHYKDTSLKKKLIREVVQSLVKTKYKEDETSTEYISVISKNNTTTTSTSDSNNLDNRKPKKSILRTQNFNSNSIASTSQSAPNLPVISDVDHIKPLKPTNLSSTDSDPSYQNKYLSDIVIANSSSEEIYKKYLLTCKKKDLYKKHLKESNLLLSQSVTHPNEIINIKGDLKAKSNLEHLIKDLAKNNHADGSGDASKLHCGSGSNMDAESGSLHRFRSHSVFTLSSENTENIPKKNKKLRNRLECGINSCVENRANVKCHCSASKKCNVALTDSSVQVNFDNEPNSNKDKMTNEQNIPEEYEPKTSAGSTESKAVFDNFTEDVQYVCLCTEESPVPDNFLIYKCSRLHNKCIMMGANRYHLPTEVEPGQLDSKYKVKFNDHCSNKYLPSDTNEKQKFGHKGNTFPQQSISNESSQTDSALPNYLLQNLIHKSESSSSAENKCSYENKDSKIPLQIEKKEGTQWVQTDFTIDPTLSDPSITDIRFFDYECNDIINQEENKSVSSVQLSYTNNQFKYNENKTDIEPNEPLPTDKNMAAQSSKEKQQENIDDTDIQIKTKLSPRCKIQKEKNDATNFFPQNKFIIPIHGTNMTLRVSLASGEKNPSPNQMNTVNKTTSQDSLASSNVKTSGSDCMTSGVYNDNVSCIEVSSIGIQTENMVQQKKVDKNTVGTMVINDDTKTSHYVQADGKRLSASYNTYNFCTDTNYICVPEEIIKKDGSNSDNNNLGSNDHLTSNKKGNKTQSDRSNSDNKNLESNDHLTSNKKGNNTQCGNCVKPELTPESRNKATCCHRKESRIDNGEIAKEEEKDVSNNCNGNCDSHLTSNKKGNKTQSGRPNSGNNNLESNNHLTSNMKGKKTQSDRSNSDNHNLESNDTLTSNKKGNNTQCGNCVKPVLTPESRTKATCCHSKESKIDNEEIAKEEKDVSNNCSGNCDSSASDPLLDIIYDITKRFSKKEKLFKKDKGKKCYNEIINVLNYLLDTSDSTHKDGNKSTCCTSEANEEESTHSSKTDNLKKKVNKSIQWSPRKCKVGKAGKTVGKLSNDFQSTSTESCKTHRRHEVVNYIKHKCKYHPKKFEDSSSSSVNCHQCYHCYCRGQKRHRMRSLEKCGKKCVAYNLTLQTSDSIASEDLNMGICGRQLKNIIVKVPSKHRANNMQFKEVEQKIERNLPKQPCCNSRSHSVPRANDSSAENVCKESSGRTLREYLEINKPDFVERCSRRQTCLKSINEARSEYNKHVSMMVVHAPNDRCQDSPTICCGGSFTRTNERAIQRQVLSMHVGRADVGALSETDLRRLAGDLGRDLRTRVAPKFINEKEMKKHSEKIYKTLPEVQRKKDELLKERIKKTNLLMANLFKKNLQKKALRGSVNLSNYSNVIKL